MLLGIVATKYKATVEADHDWDFDVREHFFPDAYDSDGEDDPPPIDDQNYHLLCTTLQCQPYLNFHPQEHVFSVDRSYTKRLHQETKFVYILLFTANYVESRLLYLELTVTPYIKKVIVPVINISEPYVEFYYKNRGNFPYEMVKPA